jgi:mobilization protein
LQKNFEASQKAETNVSAQVIRKSSEHTDTKDAGYQLVPPRLSYSPRATEDTPQIAQAIRAVADTAISAADELVEGVGGMITPMTHGEDYAETAWQRKLRYQANRKKKGRRL